MTRTEYLNQKASIIKSHGEPEWDFDRSPKNKAAEEIKSLNLSYARASRQNKKNKALASNSSNSTDNKDMMDKSTISDTNTRHTEMAVVIPIKLEPFLAQFTEEEQSIIKVAANFPYMNSQEMAELVQTTRQKVAAFLDSDRYIEFRGRLLKELQDETPIRVYARLERLSKSSDPKVALDASKQLMSFSGLHDKKKEETVEKDNIKDPIMAEYLRLLGNWVAAGCKNQLVIDPPASR